MFGVQDQLGVVFAHNVFTVQFLFDRLPLYIVALYPAVVSLAYEIVRSLGVFRDRGIVAGAICVGFVHHCFYEVFDQLGPQLHWWAWNSANPINRPMLASVPMTSVFIFATLGPIVVTVLVLQTRQRRSHLAGRTVLAGALVPVGIAVLGIPTSVFGGRHPHTSAQAVIFSVELAAIAAFALPILIRIAAGTPPPPNGFVRIFGPLYLVVLAALWASAFPPSGVCRTGGCFVVSAAGVAAVGWPRARADQSATTEISLPRRYGAISGRSSPLQNRPGSNQFVRFSVSISPISS